MNTQLALLTVTDETQESAPAPQDAPSFASRSREAQRTSHLKGGEAAKAAVRQASQKAAAKRLQRQRRRNSQLLTRLGTAELDLGPGSQQSVRNNRKPAA